MVLVLLDMQRSSSGSMPLIVNRPRAIFHPVQVDPGDLLAICYINRSSKTPSSSAQNVSKGVSTARGVDKSFNEMMEMVIDTI